MLFAVLLASLAFAYTDTPFSAREVVIEDDVFPSERPDTPFSPRVQKEVPMAVWKEWQCGTEGKRCCYGGGWGVWRAKKYEGAGPCAAGLMCREVWTQSNGPDVPYYTSKCIKDDSNWQCYHYTGSQDDAWCKAQESAGKGFVLTYGKDAKYPGCGECACCVKTYKCYTYVNGQNDAWCQQQQKGEGGGGIQWAPKGIVFKGGELQAEFPGCGWCSCCVPKYGPVDLSFYGDAIGSDGDAIIEKLTSAERKGRGFWRPKVKCQSDEYSNVAKCPAYSHCWEDCKKANCPVGTRAMEYNCMCQCPGTYDRWRSVPEAAAAPMLESGGELEHQPRWQTLIAGIRQARNWETDMEEKALQELLDADGISSPTAVEIFDLCDQLGIKPSLSGLEALVKIKEGTADGEDVVDVLKMVGFTHTVTPKEAEAILQLLKGNTSPANLEIIISGAGRYWNTLKQVLQMIGEILRMFGYDPITL